MKTKTVRPMSTSQHFAMGQYLSIARNLLMDASVCLSRRYPHASVVGKAAERAGGNNSSVNKLRWDLDSLICEESRGQREFDPVFAYYGNECGRSVLPLITQNYSEPKLAVQDSLRRKKIPLTLEEHRVLGARLSIVRTLVERAPTPNPRSRNIRHPAFPAGTRPPAGQPRCVRSCDDPDFVPLV